MKLLSLSQNHFKKVVEDSFEPKGANARIYGDNETGKTTKMDAFYWLLFGKDSLNQVDFDIKTRRNGIPISSVDHRVEGEFLLTDGKLLRLTREYKEVHTKTRGQATSKFSGHTTNFKVNGIGVAAGEYKHQVDQICPERLFRELTDALHFNTKVSWQDRRKRLIEMCGDVTDQDVIASEPDLAELPDIVGAYSIDDYRKLAGQRRREANKELEEIPNRIDERRREIGEPLDAPATNIDELRAEQEQLRELKAQANHGGLIAEKQVEIRKIESELIEITNRLKTDANSGRDTISASLRSKRSEVDELRRKIGSKSHQVADAEARHRQLEGERTAILSDYNRENSKVFDFTDLTACAACGQAIPSERVAEVRQRAEEQFNKSRSERIEKLLENGKAKRKDVDAAATQLELHRTDLDSLKAQLPALESAVASLQADYDSTEVKGWTPTAHYKEVETRKAALEAEIQRLRADDSEALGELDSKIQAVQGKIDAHLARQSAINNLKAAESRIAELEKRQGELAQTIEKCAHEEYLVDLFIRRKVSLLTEKINSRFQIVRWRLFEEQINEGVLETCIATVDGVPYDSLNHGLRVNVGLDVIRTLQQFHEFYPPVWIDSAESVTRYLDMPCQVIKLVVSEKDKTLRYEFDAAVADIPEHQGVLN